MDPLLSVHNSVYSAQAFELERDRILRRVWTFVSHASELREVGHFLTLQVAGDPILIVRSRPDTLQAFHNVCRHRGSLVVPEPAGQRKAFQCCYHHWLYSLEGKLLAVPGEEAYAWTDFCREDYGLVPVRLESVFGLVFVCLDSEAPSLQEYLGEEVLTVLEQPLGRVEYEVFHSDSWLLKANWKLFAENGRDGYHVPFVHQSFLGYASPPAPYTLFESGHAVQEALWAKAAVDEETWVTTTGYPLPGFEPGQGWIANIFPDLVVMARTSVAEIFSQTPITPEETQFEVRVLAPVGDSPEARKSRQRAFEVWLQTQQPEDRAAMENQQRGLASRSVRTSLIARGPAGTTGLRGDDNRLRQFWRVWRSMMGVQANGVMSDE